MHEFFRIHPSRSKVCLAVALALILTSAASGEELPSAKELYILPLASGTQDELIYRVIAHFQNPTQRDLSGHLESFARDGSPLAWERVSAEWAGVRGTFQQELNWISFTVTAGSMLIMTLTPPDSLVMGWGRLNSSQELSVQAFMQVARSHEFEPSELHFEEFLLHETEILPASVLTSARVPVTFFRGFRNLTTALGVVNPTAQKATVRVSFGSGDGKVVSLGPGELFTGFFDQFFDGPVIAIFPLRISAIAEIRSDVPIGLAVFRTLDGLPISGVSF